MLDWTITRELNEIICRPGRQVTAYDSLNWIAPPSNWIKISTDAAISSDGRIGFAAIIRDSLRAIISAEIRCVRGPPNAFLGESTAALMGIYLLQDD